MIGSGWDSGSGLLHLVRIGLGALLRGYLAPVRLHPRLLLWAKDAGLLCPSEHLYRTLRVLRQRPLWGRPSLVVDVGGADGEVAALLASAMPRASVYSYEPNTRAWPGLEARFAGTDVQVRRLALGDVAARARFHVTKNRVSSSLLPLDPARLAERPEGFRRSLHEVEGFDVVVSTLDDELSSVTLPLALLKLDTQGTERQILEGGRAVLQRTDVVLTEVANHRLYTGGCLYHEVDEHLRKAGFHLRDIIVTYRSATGLEEYDAVYLREPPLE